MTDFLLPGEPKRLPGEPADHVRYVHSLPLDAFRLVHGDHLSWSRDHVWAFRRALFRSSFSRRIRTGSQGLMRDAARLVIRQFEPAVFRIYRDRQMIVLLTDEARDELAIALAHELRSSVELKIEVTNTLENVTSSIAIDEGTIGLIPNFASYDERSSVVERLNSWNDELEYMRDKGDYRRVIHIHKLIVACSRVSDAVLAPANAS